MVQPTSPEPLGATPRADFQAEIDALSLSQALIDVEIANGRVVDLTQRLIEALDTNVRLREDLEQLRGEHQELQRVHHGAVTSRAYRLAEKVSAVRRMLRGR